MISVSLVARVWKSYRWSLMKGQKRSKKEKTMPTFTKNNLPSKNYDMIHNMNNSDFHHIKKSETDSDSVPLNIVCVRGCWWCRATKLNYAATQWEKFYETKVNTQMHAVTIVSAWA